MKRSITASAIAIAGIALVSACGSSQKATNQPAITTTTMGPDLSGAALRSLAKPWCAKLRKLAANESDMGLPSKTIDLFHSAPTSYVQADADQVTSHAQAVALLTEYDKICTDNHL
jgi:hypothetical protein